MASLGATPAHVPDELVVDIDIYAIEGGERDHLRAWSVIQQRTPDIYFSRHYGGFWIFNRAEHIACVLQDPLLFSSAQSTSIPPIEGAPPFPPLYIDPPLHRYFRKPLSLAFGGQNPKLLGARAREIVVELIDRVVDAGECEFMHQFALHVPVALVLAIFDLPFEDRARLVPYADAITHSSDQAERDAAIGGIFAYADHWVRQREAAPGHDLISQLLTVTIEDRAITHDETTAMVALILLGGLDSVSHTMGAIMRTLAEDAVLQADLASAPERIQQMLNELIRRHSVNGMARTLTADTELGGVRLAAGDKVFAGAWLYGLDPRRFDDPLTVRAGRTADMMAFGTGVHTCVGMALAKLEIRVLLEEWLARIPSFRIKPGDAPVTTTGQTLGTVHLPLSWPGGAVPR